VTSLRFSFATNLFVDRPLEAALEAIAAAGFGEVEILADEPHARLDRMNQTDAAAIARSLASFGLRVSALNANTVRCMSGTGSGDFFAFRPSLHERDPNARRTRVEYTRRAIRLCAALGSPVCVIASGPKPAPEHREVERSLLNESLPELIDCADENGVRLAFEYEPGLLIGSFRELRSLLSRHEMLTGNLDIGHAVVCGESPVEIAQRLGGRIGNVHFEDICGCVHRHLPPGEGDIDLAKVLDTLEALSYDGAVAFELYSCTDRADQVLQMASSYAKRRQA
jgi:sugar phosphate isomerase/epimerase